jgi:hypothetical protein
MLDVDEASLSALRQRMLSCTVENRPKDLVKLNPAWHFPISAARNQSVLQGILTYLGKLKDAGELNNPGIPRMVSGYFFEMACVIWESARVLQPAGTMFVVNDNVRYEGADIPVDLILSDIAEELGFCVKEILVLPIGKGNSSQQMGNHGRSELRKCVYVWKKKPVDTRE